MSCWSVGRLEGVDVARESVVIIPLSQWGVWSTLVILTRQGAAQTSYHINISSWCLHQTLVMKKLERWQERSCEGLQAEESQYDGWSAWIMLLRFYTNHTNVIYHWIEFETFMKWNCTKVIALWLLSAINLLDYVALLPKLIADRASFLLIDVSAESLRLCIALSRSRQGLNMQPSISRRREWRPRGEEWPWRILRRRFISWPRWNTTISSTFTRSTRTRSLSSSSSNCKY